VTGPLHFLLRGAHAGPSDYRLTRWVLLRLLGLVFLIAFVSLWVQAEGLMGSRGILPVGDYLDGVEQRPGGGVYLQVPTLFWLARGDAFLHLVCGAGTLLSLALVVGVAQLPVLLLLWALYLSLVTVGGAFLSFQWDILLLETALMAMFLAPRQQGPCPPRSESGSPRAGILLLRVLLFKLMFLSGIVKLISLDDTWWQLTALDYHYFTQPLPAWTSWYAHQLPEWFQRQSVLVMFLIELVVPFLIFGPRGLRLLASGALVLLQASIGLTGNYNFFNLLTVVLCVSLLDDAFLEMLVSRRAWSWLSTRSDPPRHAAPPAGTRPRRVWLVRRSVHGVLIAALILASSTTLVREMVRTRPPGRVEGISGSLLELGERVTGAAAPLLRVVAPFRSINGYGLFRSMTTERPEINLEVSRDGREWRELAFRWKPGDVARRPGFVQPHQPRLDWQMWFAALNPRRAGYWLERLVFRLLDGSPEVWSLLAEPDLAARPPRYLRLVYYRYEFTTPDERSERGDWWRRTRQGASPAFSLDDFRPRPPVRGASLD
jgi:hypothetical protein